MEERKLRWFVYIVIVILVSLLSLFLSCSVNDALGTFILTLCIFICVDHVVSYICDKYFRR